MAYCLALDSVTSPHQKPHLFLTGQLAVWAVANSSVAVPGGTCILGGLPAGIV